MPPAGEKRRYSQFLDIEAEVDIDEEGDHSDSDMSTDDDFIAEDTNDVLERRLSQRGVAFASEEATAQELEALARAIESRARRIEHGEHGVSDTIDTTFWRVRVKANFEQPVVSDLLEKRKDLGSQVNIVTIFSRFAVKRSIYVVATDPKDVRTLLEGVAGICRNSQGPQLDIVPFEERLSLLKMTESASFLTFNPMEWIRIKRRGRYRDSLGLVKSINSDTFTCQVLMVRIGPSAKRKESKHELIERAYNTADITNSFVHPSNAELDMFKHSGNHLAQQALSTIAVSLHIDDWVEVLDGSLQGLKGHIIDIRDDKTVTVLPTQRGTAQVDVLSFEVRKHFILGDLVRVAYGHDKGEEGFIVDLNISSVTILNHKQSYKELEVLRRYIDFADTTNEPNSSKAIVKRTRSETYTGESYMHMEVSVISGVHKGKYGKIIASREQDGQLSVTVQPWSISGNLKTFHLSADKVIEQWTKLPINQARWIPGNVRVFGMPPPPPERGLTPPPRDGEEWLPDDSPPEDPGDSSSLAGPSTPSLPAIPDPSPGPKPGEWLLNYRLARKTFQVRVRGTIQDSFYKGKYENEWGVITLDTVLSSVDATIVVKVGDFKTKRHFRIHHLYPDARMDGSSQVSVVVHPGARVVIIGPDVAGNSRFVGSIGEVIATRGEIPAGVGCVYLRHLIAAYHFPETSLCRC